GAPLGVQALELLAPRLDGLLALLGLSPHGLDLLLDGLADLGAQRLLALAVAALELGAGLGGLLLVGEDQVALARDQRGLALLLPGAQGLLEQALALGQAGLQLAPALQQLGV